MNLKTYSTENNAVNYRYSLQAKKWEFSVPSKGSVYLCHVKDRSIGAAKVANIIAGAIKRAGQIDGLARANIAKFARF